jgi:hypothetical protein
MTIHGPYTGQEIVCRTGDEALRVSEWLKWVREERESRKQMRQLEQGIRKQLKTR